MTAGSWVSALAIRSAYKAVKLTYEELYFSEPSRQEEQVWDMLELPHLKLERHQMCLQPETAKNNSAATYAFLPNAQEIDNICGNDETGWLYGTHSRY